MFNRQKSKKQSQVTTEEKMLRRDNVGPKADDNQAITEKELKHRSGYEDVTTEKQLESSHTEKDVKIIEGVLNDSKNYRHRNDNADISVPPINALVEKMRQNRLAEDWKPEKESHWSQTFDEKKQQGDLPKFPKNPAQHDKVVLNNDPRRFKDIKNLPTHTDRSKNDAARSKGGTIRPLVGDITTADIDSVAYKIKVGESIDYDTAMVAILAEAMRDKRELTTVERKAVVDLKIARTKALLKKYA